MNAGDSIPRRGFRSLTARLIVWMLVSCGAVYAATVVVANTLGRRMAIAAAEREAVNKTAATARGIEDVLHAVEERTRLFGSALETTDPAPDVLERLLRRFVAGNPDVWGAAVAYAPGAERPGSALYYHRTRDESDELAAADPTSDAYRRWERDAFTAPVRTGGPLWTEPARDPGDGSVSTTTYALPFRGPDGSVRGVVSADVRLRRLDALVASLQLGRHGFGFVLSRTGRVIAVSDTDVAPRGLALDDWPPATRAQFDPVVRRMLNGEQGFLPVEVRGRAYRLTYQPVARAGWTLAALYAEDELLAGVARLRAVQAALALGGLALLAAVVVAISRRFTRPLAALAASAERMATGDLEAELPPVTSRDEVGTLARAFHHMRDSLQVYIRDLRETTAAKERLESELKIARRIQTDMLPRADAGGPREGYELGAKLVPARAIGGDLYLHFREGARVFVLVGDVSGKGIPAALFMARTKTLFDAVAAREGQPGAILHSVNHSLCRDNDAGMFVTAVCGVLDLDSGELSFACAGHDPPVLVPTQGEPQALEAEGGRVLGLIEASDYPANRVRLAPREAVVLYTDGVSEAQNAAGEFFGLERLLATARTLGHEDATQMSAGLLAAVRAFAGAAPQSDDITLLTLRHLPPMA